MTFFLLIALSAFLLGSLPTGFLVAKSRGVDIRQHGSGNIGATNVLRTLGKGPGYFVFAVDAFKGALAVLLSGWVAQRFAPDQLLWAQILGGICGILGHNFTPWLGFKGGKGVATSAGVLLALLNPLVVLSVLLVWYLTLQIGRYVSLASICAGLALPLAVWLIVVRPAPEKLPVLWFGILVGAMLVLRHHKNIQRLFAGTEPRMERKKK